MDRDEAHEALPVPLGADAGADTGEWMHVHRARAWCRASPTIEPSRDDPNAS